jgi:predicted nucleic-acid-binding Zn-ribbon protein
MRTSGHCPKCDGSEVLLVDTVPDTGEFAGEIRSLHVATVSAGTSFFGQERQGRAGKLEAAVCRGCGFVEFYAAEPGAIPIDGKLVRLMTPPPKTGPHR